MVIRQSVVVPFGDSGVLVAIDGDAGVETSRNVHAVAGRIRAATVGLEGWGKPVPAATSVLVPVDPVEPGVDAAIEHLMTVLATLASEDDGPLGVGAAGGALERTVVVEIPVRYGGLDGPDLATVAAMTSMTEDDVIEAHAAVTYTAMFIGFAPGFAYLGPLDPALVLARQDEPRQLVRAGSVAIAGPQTAVYPVDSPGGWWILGRTSREVWNPGREPPATIAAGSRVRFVPERS